MSVCYLLDTNICIYIAKILVTNNTRELSRVPGLQLENWAEDPSIA